MENQINTKMNNTRPQNNFLKNSQKFQKMSYILTHLKS